MSQHLTLSGLYRDGQVQLTDPPSLPNETPVLVMFLDAEQAVPQTAKPSDKPKGKIMTSGCLAVPK